LPQPGMSTREDVPAMLEKVETLEVAGSTRPAETLPLLVGPGQTKPIPGAVADFELLDIVGRGGMGVVYRARQVKLDRIVALKMILAGEHAEPQQVERFLAEARAIARLQHPHIVQVYEIGEVG